MLYLFFYLILPTFFKSILLYKYIILVNRFFRKSITFIQKRKESIILFPSNFEDIAFNNV